MSLQTRIEDLRKYRSLLLVIFVFCMMSTFSFLATRGMQRSNAASTSGFQAGNIISDAVMANYNSMSTAEIQAFLNSKNKCNNTNYNLYLSLKAQYPVNDWHFENGHFVCLAEELFGDGTEVGSGQTAAEIIYQAAQDYRINPQVLLVLLEKEQSLITDTYPNAKQYRSATGYGCPDTAACDTKYYGFKNQVRNAAALFRDVLDHGYYAYPEKQAGVYVGYNPSASCGRSEVYIENRATAALYRYTPYQPNAAALAAGYGIGDSCSAYGNRNFYLYFTDWFGSTQANPEVSGQELALADGVYSFVSAMADNRALGVSQSNVELRQHNSQDSAQFWSVERQDNGYYKLKNTASNQYLVAVEKPQKEGVNVATSTSVSNCQAQWKLYLTPDGFVTFESACVTGMVIDVYNEDTYVGTNIHTWLVNGGKNQKWALYTGRTLADGNYTISSQLNAEKVLDIYNNEAVDGTNVQLWTKNGGANQLWRLTYNADTDDYTIINPASKKALDLNTAIAKEGQNIQLWTANSSCAQRWKVVPGASGYTLVSSCNYSMSADLANGATADGTNLQLWGNNNGSNQCWNFTAVSPTVSNGEYVIVTALDGDLVLDIYNNEAVDGTNVQLWTKNGGANQLWRLTYNADTDDYTIINPASKKALDLNTAIAKEGQNIQLWTANSSCAQRWKVVPGASGYTLVSSCQTSMVLDVYNLQAKDGTNVQLWTKNGGANQLWRLVKP